MSAHRGKPGIAVAAAEMAFSGRDAMSDVSPKSAPKRTFAGVLNLAKG
jgi:hypothetical protein